MKTGIMKKLYKSILFLTIVISLFASCSNELDLTNSVEATVENAPSLQYGFYGNIDLHTNQDNNSRAAIPSINVNGTNYYYYVKAEQTSGGSGSFTIDGSTAEGRASLVYSVASKKTCFEMGLTFGNWEITVSVKEAIENETDPDVLMDTYPVTISASNPIVEHTFILMPENSGTGTIALPIIVPNTINRIQIECDELQDQMDEGKLTVTGSWTSYTIQGNEIPSGIYSFVLRFYGNNNALLYKTLPVSINVFDNMTTATWVDDGVVSTSSGSLSLTSSTIQSFVSPTMYVGNTVYARGDDDSSGSSPFTPLKTVAEALNRINTAGSSSTDYTIKICGTVKENVIIETTRFNNLFFDSGTDTPAVLDGDQKGSVITVNSSNKFIYINNLTIQNGSGTPEEEDSTIKDGGGIYIKSGNLELQTGAKVTGNTATNGGGVYIDTNAKLFMEYTSLIGDSLEEVTATLEDSSKYANKAKYGGGIYNNGGYICVGCNSTGGTSGWNISPSYGIRRNYATESGGGIYQKSGYFRFIDANISYNACEKDGGGVYFESVESDSATTIYPCSINGNKALEKGGGFYIAYGCTVNFNRNDNYDLYLKDNCVEASENKDALGGAVYNEGTLNSNCDLDVSGNKAITSGSGNAYGGAFYNANQLTFDAGYGIAIYSNSAKTTGTGKARGGAIYNSEGATLDMKYAGLASSNDNLNKVEAAEGQIAEGGAIYQNGTMSISKKNGSYTKIYPGSEKNNDVYLPAGKRITINGTFNESGSIATITPASFNVCTSILQKGSSEDISEEEFKNSISKFTLTNIGANSSGNYKLLYYRGFGSIAYDQSIITSKQWITDYMEDKHWNEPGQILDDDNNNPDLLTLLLKDVDKYTVVTISLAENSISKISYDLDFKVFDQSITSIQREVSETDSSKFALLKGCFTFDGSIASDSDSAALTLEYNTGITSNVQWYLLQ